MRFDGGCEGGLWIELLDFEKAPLSKILNPTKYGEDYISRR